MLASVRRFALRTFFAVGMALAMASAGATDNEVAWRTLSARDPHALIEQGRQMLDAGRFGTDPAGERELLWWMGHAAVSASDHAALTEIIARLSSLGSTHGDSLAVAYAGFLRADGLIDRGDPGGVAEALRAAAQVQRRADPAVRALVQFQICDVYTMTGDVKHALPICQAAAAAYRRLHDEWNLAQAENDIGNVLINLGRYQEAASTYERARGRYRQLGDHSQAVMVGDNLAQVYLRLHRPADALALSRASLADERAAGRLSDALISRSNIARALDALGDSAQARVEIAAAVDEARKDERGGILPTLLQIQSEQAESSGDLKLALAAEREVVQVRDAQRAPGIEAEEATLDTRYAAREKELRIRDLERNNQMQKLQIQTAQAESQRRNDVVVRQRLALVLGLVALAALVVVSVLLWLLLRSQRRNAALLRAQTLLDPLTGVENRRGFFERTNALLAQRKATGSMLHALMLIDIDHFKRINDTGGHPFGDVVLCAVCDCLRRVAAAHGTLARLGGEEFAVLCPRIGGEAALQLAECLRAEVAALRFGPGHGDTAITISIGVALFDGHRSHDADSWTRNADDALYMAKGHGRNRVVASAAIR